MTTSLSKLLKLAKAQTRAFNRLPLAEKRVQARKHLKDAGILQVKKKRAPKQSKGQRYPAVLQFLRQFDIAACEELKFHETRRWRFDFACPTQMIAVEIDGGVWSGGRHSGGTGQIADMEKGNEAVLCGWKVFHFTPQQINTKYFIETLRRALDG